MINRYQPTQNNYNPAFHTRPQAAVPVKAAGNEAASSQKTAQAVQEGRFDKVDVTRDWKQMAIDTLNELSDKYENVVFGILDFDSSFTLRNYASFLGKGQYLYMSTSFLEKMGSGPAEYAECTSRLEQALKSLSEEGKNGLPEKMVNQGVYLTDNQTAVWKTLLEEKDDNPLLPKEDEKKNLLPWLTEQEKNTKSIFDQDLSRFSINTKNLLTSPGTSGANVAAAKTFPLPAPYGAGVYHKRQRRAEAEAGNQTDGKGCPAGWCQGPRPSKDFRNKGEKGTPGKRTQTQGRPENKCAPQ